MSISKEQQMEEFFLSILEGCTKHTLEKYPEAIFFKKDGEVIMEQDNKNKIFWLDYKKIWKVFSGKFSLNYTETQLFLNDMLDKHLNLKGYTPKFFLFSVMNIAG